MITDFVDAEHYVRSELFDMELPKSRCVQVSLVVLFVVPIKLLYTRAVKKVTVIQQLK